MATTPSDRRERGVAVCVLAAGLSTRFGPEVGGKALAPWRGETLVRRAVRVAQGSVADEVLVVVGYFGDSVAREVASLGVPAIANPDYEEGQSTSVRVGLTTLRRRRRAGTRELGAVVFCPVDQPLLEAGVIDRLVEAWRHSDRSIVAPRVGGRRRSPVLIGSELFSAVDTIEGDAGARQLFTRFEPALLEVDFDDERPFFDVDTVAELRRLEQMAEGRSLEA